MYRQRVDTRIVTMHLIMHLIMHDKRLQLQPMPEPRTRVLSDAPKVQERERAKQQQGSAEHQRGGGECAADAAAVVRRRVGLRGLRVHGDPLVGVCVQQPERGGSLPGPWSLLWEFGCPFPKLLYAVLVVKPEWLTGEAG